MGNHDVGRSMSASARVFMLGRSVVSQEDALVALDLMTEPWRGTDAEFDDEAYPGTPLGDLIGAAFAPGQAFTDGDEGDERWFEGPYTQFRERYHFW